MGMQDSISWEILLELPPGKAPNMVLYPLPALQATVHRNGVCQDELHGHPGAAAGKLLLQAGSQDGGS